MGSEDFWDLFDDYETCCEDRPNYDDVNETEHHYRYQPLCKNEEKQKIEPITRKTSKLFDRFALWVNPARECKKCCLFCSWFDMCWEEQGG